METNPVHPLAIPLYGSTTHQSWGAKGLASNVARMLMSNKFCAIDPHKSYSEFIVSTHPSHPPTVLLTTPSVALQDHIQTQVIEVDSTMVEFYSRLHQHGIPYILKLVSVSSHQTVQVHPTDQFIKTLPEAQDEAGKALMLVAQNDAELLFGFQSAKDIVAELSRVPEFADAVGRPETDHFVHIVKTVGAKAVHIEKLVRSLFEKSAEHVKQCMHAAAHRLLKMPEEAVTENDRRFMAFRKEFAEDPACLFAYLLNRVMMKQGQAVFIHPGEPYCVLRGEFVEASSFSERVLKGGLGEGRQVEQFLNALSFDDSPVEVSNGERFSDFGVSYVPPVPQFQLLEFKLPQDVSQQMVETIAPSIVMVLDGEGTIKVNERDPLLPLHTGSVYYLNPQTQFSVSAVSRRDTPLHLVQIGVNESAAPSSSTSCTIM